MGKGVVMRKYKFCLGESNIFIFRMKVRCVCGVVGRNFKKVVGVKLGF